MVLGRGHNLGMISVDAFSSLSQQEQINRLQMLGERALLEWDISAERIEPLVHAENTTFHVFSPQGEFNLRISRPGYQSTSNIQSELAFLSALRQEGFRVPDPVQDRLVTASVPEVPEARDCVLFRWMNGEFRRENLSSDESRMVGAAMAQLHEFSARWNPPAGFDRQHNHEWAMQPRTPRPFDDPIEGIAEEDRLLLRNVHDESRELLRSLRETPETFGLIHADLHVGNLLFDDGQLNIIDFDDAGFAFLYYDFASSLAFQVSRPNFVEVRDALLAGYESVKSLPPHTESMVRPFLRMRLGGVATWILKRTDNPAFRETAPQWVRSFCDSIRKLDDYSY